MVQRIKNNTVYQNGIPTDLANGRGYLHGYP